jgi:hypothetical protein
MSREKTFTPAGQSLVEFAIVIPIILLMVAVIFDLGRVVYYSSTIHNAAREGTRWGIVYPNNEGDIQDKSVNFAIGLGLNRGNVAVCWHYNPEYIYSFPPPSVKVTVTYNFVPVTPLVARFITGGHLILTGEAVMKLEALPDVDSINNCRY